MLVLLHWPLIIASSISPSLFKIVVPYHNCTNIFTTLCTPLLIVWPHWEIPWLVLDKPCLVHWLFQSSKLLCTLRHESHDDCHQCSILKDCLRSGRGPGQTYYLATLVYMYFDLLFTGCISVSTHFLLDSHTIWLVILKLSHSHIFNVPCWKVCKIVSFEMS